MRKVILGRSMLEVTAIAYGTWQFGGDWGPVDEDAAIEAIRAARQLGVTFFDTAQGYGFGRAERVLGRALADELRSVRGELVLATKGGLRMDGDRLGRAASPDWLRRGVDASLQALGVDYIDLFQLHWPDPATPITQSAEALAALVDEGLIHHVGVSNFSVAEMQEFSAVVPVETLQSAYHLFRRDIEGDVLGYTAAEGIGVLVYGPLAHGLLGGVLSDDTAFPADDWRSGNSAFTGEPFRRNLAVVDELRFVASLRGATVGQLAVAWTLANPAVNVAIVGSRRPEHLRESVGALDLQLTAADLAEIDSIMVNAVPMGGPTPEAMP